MGVGVCAALAFAVHDGSGYPGERKIGLNCHVSDCNLTGRLVSFPAESHLDRRRRRRRLRRLTSRVMVANPELRGTAHPLDKASGTTTYYEQAVENLTRSYRAVPKGEKVRLAKKSSNLFRQRSAGKVHRLDVSAFGSVLSVDPQGQWADVGGMATYEHIVDARLPHGVMPKVVPQLKTITLGGALSGLGIESTSFRSGMPHETVIDMDVLTGDGRVVTARPEGEHSDLFYGFPNSYGTLGYALRARIEVEPVSPYVRLRHVRFDSFEEVAESIGVLCETRRFEGAPVDFLDGTVFSRDECYLSVGTWSDEAPLTSDYTRDDIYYKSIQHRSRDWLCTRDYLWRWDSDWFWCSKAFYAQNAVVRRLAGRRFLRSDVYWKIMAFEERYKIKARIDARRGQPERENVIQDVEVPVERLAEFLDGFTREVPILPVWLCPLRQLDPAVTWDLYPLDSSKTYVNVGFWSSVPVRKDAGPAYYNRWVEDEVERLDGRKSLYSTAFYEPERFWALYNGPVYETLKGRYDPDSRLTDLYAKCVKGS